jgi:hypothetical protein
VYFEQEVSNEKEEHTLVSTDYHHDSCDYFDVSLYQCNTKTDDYIDTKTDDNVDTYADDYTYTYVYTNA